mmetsp:Transcript_14325/g.22364  ORF Transcript_14325/g.22364 Transcript_14325/m.22364 type:complete len:209 (-) Transcript_14325:469-1095(-)
MKTPTKVALIAIIFALFAKMFRTGAPDKFAFDTSFPADGMAWYFQVITGEGETALADLEAETLDKLEMSPMFRCGNGIFGERWIGKGLFSGSIRPLLLRIYKLVLEDANPPDENKFIVRHQILGWKSPMTTRFDEFTCASPEKGKVCKHWTSTGFVSEFFTKRLTKGATTNPYYKQELRVVPGSNEVPKACPLIKESFWCLWVFCPAV